jgi:uncharacterized cupredoxin-like copper-binding protein
MDPARLKAIGLHQVGGMSLQCMVASPGRTVWTRFQAAGNCEQRCTTNTGSMSMRFISRGVFAALLTIGLVTGLSHQSRAGETIKVSLVDKGAAMEMPKDLGMGMGADLSMATMSVVVDKTKVKAGDVTFVVTNDSKEMIHEMLVAPADPTKQLPFVTGDLRVDEEAARDLGEVSELDPGKSGSLTINLAPGTDILFCNIAGHYMSGMWTLITVE